MLVNGRFLSLAAAIGIATAFLGTEVRQAGGQPMSPAFESVGPHSFGGRTRSLVVVQGGPGSPEVLLAGSAGGGLWRSRNAGESWESVPELSQQSVTSLVASPAAPLTLYAGTGEIDQDLRGGGIFRSLDGGESWASLPGTNGEELAFIRRLSVSADGAQILAATSQGLFESSTSAFSFRCALPAPHGCGEPMSDVISHPKDLSKAVAASADTATVFYRELVGTALQWREAEAETGTGPPKVTRLAWSGNGIGKRNVSLTYAIADPNIVYASVDGEEIDGGPLWRSEDGGKLFKRRAAGPVPCVSPGRSVDEVRVWANLIWAGHPTDPNFVIMGRLDLWRSTDGGTSLTVISDFDKHPLSPHADHHIMATGPDFGTRTLDPFRAWLGTDGGVFYTSDLTAAAKPCEPVAWTERNTGYGAVQFYSGMALSGGTLLLGAQDLGLLRREPVSTCGAGSPCWAAGEIIKGSVRTPVRDDIHVVLGQPASSKDAFALGNKFDVLRTMSSGNSWEYISDNHWNGTDWIRVSGNHWPIGEAEIKLSAPPAFAISSSQSPRLYLGGGCLYQCSNPLLKPITESSRPFWSRMRSPLRNKPCDTKPTISAIAIHPGDPDDLWLCYEDGRIFRTKQALSLQPSWRAVGGAPESTRGRSCKSLEVLSTGGLLVAFSGKEQPNVYLVAKAARVGSGYSWTPVDLPEELVYQATAHPRNSQRIFVATEGGVLETCASCKWRALPGLPSQRTRALFWHGEHLYVGTYGSGVYVGRIP
jgi:photosystem II stability/assembly factor-like uncharacterized protein